MRGYNIYSLLQPTDMAWISRDGSNWLVMLDTGRLDHSPVYGTPDYERGKTLMQNGGRWSGFILNVCACVCACVCVCVRARACECVCV